MSRRDWLENYPIRRDWAGQRLKERYLVLDSLLFTLKDNALHMFFTFLTVIAIWCLCDQYGLFEYIRTHSEHCTENFELKTLINSLIWCGAVNIVFFIRWYYQNKKYIDESSFMRSNFDVFRD